MGEIRNQPNEEWGVTKAVYQVKYMAYNTKEEEPINRGRKGHDANDV